MQVTAEVECHDVAREMEADGGFAMDVFASLADAPEKLMKELAENGIACEWHESVPGFLRALAEILERKP